MLVHIPSVSSHCAPTATKTKLVTNSPCRIVATVIYFSSMGLTLFCAIHVSCVQNTCRR